MRFSIVLILGPIVSALAQHPVDGFQGSRAGGAHPPSPTASAVRQFGPRTNAARPVNSYGWPLWLGGYDYAYPSYSPAPNVVVIQQPPAYVIVPQPYIEPSKPEIYEYNLPSAPVSKADDEQQMFAIVLRDGTVDSAIGVTVQNDLLHLVEPDGGHRSIALDAIDREATRRINRERKLDLQIPPPVH